MNRIPDKGTRAPDARRIISMEQQMDRLTHPDRPESGEQADTAAEQMALFDARWNGVIPASTAEPPADTSPRGRAKAVEAYRCGVLAERKAPPDSATASKPEPEAPAPETARPEEDEEPPPR